MEIFSRFSKFKKPKIVVYNRTMGQKTQPPESCPHYLCVAAIVKDEGDYLAEWIEFHLMVGVEKFIIYDNDSKDQTHDVLKPYVQDGLVELIPWTNFLDDTNHQHLAYAHAIAYMTGKTRWLAFLDLDEFLYSPSREEIPTILSQNENYSAIIVHLSNFGTSGHKTKPEGLVIENYVERLEHNRFVQIKSIVQPHLIRGVTSAARFCNVYDYIYGYDEIGRSVVSHLDAEYSASRLRINHYMTRSLEEFERKKSRRYFWREKVLAMRRKNKRDSSAIGLEASVFDDDIFYHLDDLKERLNAKRN